VSGSSSGIGAECTRLLANEGIHVFAGLRDSSDQEPWANDDRITPIVLDVCSPTQIDAAVETILSSKAHRLTGIVNNAGIMLTGSVADLDMATVRHLFETNLFGHWRLIQLCLPLLRENRGRIVNIGSTNGRMSAPNLAAYSASKHALEALTETLHHELLDEGVSVSIVEPGVIATKLWQKLLTWEAREEGRNDARRAAASNGRDEKLRHLHEKGSTAESVAKAVLRALRDPKPRYRYIVGTDAWLRVVISSLLSRSAWAALRRAKR